MNRPDIEAIRDHFARASDCDRRDLAKVGELLAYVEQLEARNSELEEEYDKLVQAAIDAIVAVGGADELQAAFEKAKIAHLLSK